MIDTDEIADVHSVISPISHRRPLGPVVCPDIVGSYEMKANHAAVLGQCPYSPVAKTIRTTQRLSAVTIRTLNSTVRNEDRLRCHIQALGKSFSIHMREVQVNAEAV